MNKTLSRKGLCVCFCGGFVAFLIRVSSSLHVEQYSLCRALILVS